MSIKIHHGPPGSYKTSGAVMDDLIPAVKAGRVVVTNVRGLDDADRIREVLGDVPDSFDLIWVDTTTQEGREKLARWFHWIPLGAFLLIDEAQMVWPKAWKDKELSVLEYPGGVEAAREANRPADFVTAFDMHRHFGWDMVLTTPSIGKIRPDIRGASEMAYKHKNQAVIGLKGLYLEAMHLAEDSGNASDFLNLRQRRIKKHVWQLYQSTATGDHRDTLAGTPLWKNPRVLALVVGIVGLFVWLSSRPSPAVVAGGSGEGRAKRVAPDAADAPLAPAGAGAASGTAPAPVVGAGSVRALGARVDPLGSLRLYVVGQLRFDGKRARSVYLFDAETAAGSFPLRMEEIERMGYVVEALNDCVLVLHYEKRERLVTCRGRKPVEEKPVGLGAPGGFAAG